MKNWKLTRPFVAVLTGFAFVAGCEKEETTPKKTATNEQATQPTAAAPKAVAPDATPPSKPATTTPSGESGKAAPTAGGSKLELDGLTFTVPAGWQPADAGSGMFAAKAAFSLPKADGDDEGVSVRITQYPEMKGKDDLNVSRWLAQVRRPDGTPYTKENAHIRVTESGNIRLTVVDLAGSISTDMMGGGEAKPNQRMIAAIIDHPKGPHMIKATGDAASIAKWEASIDAFLKGASAN